MKEDVYKTICKRLYTCTSMPTYTNICISVCPYTYMCLCEYVHAYTSFCTCISRVCRYVYIYICMYVCMHVCLLVCTMYEIICCPCADMRICNIQLYTSVYAYVNCTYARAYSCMSIHIYVCRYVIISVSK